LTYFFKKCILGAENYEVNTMVGGCAIPSAVKFLDNRTPAEDEVWSYIWDHPGEMTQEQISEKFGLSPQEFGRIMDRLFDISFILEKDGKIFPTTLAAIMVEAYERLEKFYEEAQNSKR
jgi:hypothetical protein